MQRYSNGFLDTLKGAYGWQEVLANAVMEIYTGSQPTSANDAVQGTLLGTFTLSGAAYTGETRATGSIQLTGGASGSIDSVKVGGLFNLIGAAIPFHVDLTTTAADLAAAITAYPSTPRFEATSVGDTVTITAPIGMGAEANTLTLTSVATTITTADAAFGGGVTAVNGINFIEDPAAGVIKKEDTVWQMQVIPAGGSAGWFRIVCDPDDTGIANGSFRRLDGAISTSGAEINLASVLLSGDSVQTINQFDITLPTYK